MSDLIDTLSIILPLFASIFVIAIILINIYLKIRSKFSIKVNCWFCNENTYVPYLEKNSFICPGCTQYNGFDNDGGYNRSIPAQHYEILNTPNAISTENASNTNHSNGLCRICNNNQQLKIYQLANFVPLNENNFDFEIEHFQKQLEKAYKLCPKCDLVVRKTISKQTKWMLGLKIKHLRNKGLSYLNLNESSNKLSKEHKRSYFIIFLNTSIIVVTILILFNLLSTFNLSINKHLLHYLLPSITFIKTLMLKICFNIQNQLKNNTDFDLNKIQNLTDEVIKNISDTYPQYIKPYSPVFVLNTSGLFLQLVLTLFNKTKLDLQLLQSFIWILINASYSYQNMMDFNIYRGAMIFAMICILYCKLIATTRKISPINTKSTPRKLTQRKSLHESFSDKSISINNSFKKSQLNSTDISDTDTANSDYESFNTSIRKSKRKNKKRNINTANNTKPIFGEKAVLENSLNLSKSPILFSNFNNSMDNTFYSTKKIPNDKTSIFNQSFLNNSNNLNKTGLNNFNNGLGNNLNQTINNNGLSNNLNQTIKANPGLNTELNQSLGNLNLCTTKPTPLLSPPKFNLNKNPWSGNNLWDQKDFSRTSSQSSGFISQNGAYLDHSLPNSCSNSIAGDYDRNSIISEPAYHPGSQINDFSMNRINFNAKKSQQGLFQPFLNPNNHILIQAKQSLDLFNTNNGVRNRFENQFTNIFNNTQRIDQINKFDDPMDDL